MHSLASTAFLAVSYLREFERGIPPSFHRLTKYIMRACIKAKVEGCQEYVTRISYPRIFKELKAAGFIVREIAENCYGVKI